MHRLASAISSGLRAPHCAAFGPLVDYPAGQACDLASGILRAGATVALDINTYVRIDTVMPKPSLREHLLHAGLKVMFRLGYGGAGVRDIVNEAKAPQGSFTNHFRSKEAFAAEVLDRYFAGVRGVMAEAFDDHSLPPRERLRRYLDIITGRLERADWSRGCLVGNFSLEAPAHSEALRLQLSGIFTQWRRPFAACIAEGQAAGDITNAFEAEELADFLLAGWQGAMLRMKVERSPAPLERFKTIIFATIFPNPVPEDRE
jgi:TetR/AcrR family transcriptional regulator, transcriptional repressor for nem operon